MLPCWIMTGEMITFYNIAVFLDTIGGKKQFMDEPAWYDPKYIFWRIIMFLPFLEAGHGKIFLLLCWLKNRAALYGHTINA